MTTPERMERYRAELDQWKREHMTISAPRTAMGQQLTIPEEIVQHFRMNAEVVEYLEYEATGANAPKYRPVHWHDFIKKATTPWKPPPMNTKPLDLAKLAKLGLVEVEHGNQKWSKRA